MNTTKRLQKGRKPGISREVIALVCEEMGNDPVAFFRAAKDRLRKKDAANFALLRLAKAPSTKSEGLYQVAVLMMLACMDAQSSIDSAPSKWRREE